MLTATLRHVAACLDIIDEPAQGENLTEVFSSAKILLVDDIEVNREIAVMMLEQFGFEVETAIDGRDAVDKAARNSYDVILMDIQMPIMNGYEAASEIRKTGSRVPIKKLLETINRILKESV